MKICNNILMEIFPVNISLQNTKYQPDGIISSNFFYSSLGINIFKYAAKILTYKINLSITRQKIPITASVNDTNCVSIWVTNFRCTRKGIVDCYFTNHIFVDLNCKDGVDVFLSCLQTKHRIRSGVIRSRKQPACSNVLIN